MPKPEDEEKKNEEQNEEKNEEKSEEKKGSDETYTLQVSGSDKTFTLEELKDAAQRVAGADAKFEEAAQTKKDADRGMRIIGLMEELNKSTNPPQEKVEEFLRELGASPEQIKEQIASSTKSTTTKDGKKGDEKVELKMEDLPEEARNILSDAQKSNLAEVRGNIERDCKKGVDSDSVIGKIISGVPEGPERDKVMGVLYTMMNDDVRGRILAREAYGPEMIRSSVQKLRARIETFGISSNAAGAGPVLPAGLAAAVSTTPEIQEAEPIKRKPSTDPNWEDNFLARVQQRMLKGAKEQGRKG